MCFLAKLVLLYSCSNHSPQPAQLLESLGTRLIARIAVPFMWGSLRFAPVKSPNIRQIIKEIDKGSPE